MNNCKPVTTPMSTAIFAEMESDTNSKPFSVKRYKEILGCLLFLSTRTRPDICAAVGILSRYTARPTLTHFSLVKRILRYLRATKTHGIIISGNPGHLVSFCDADWAGDRFDRKSTTGSLLLYGLAPVSWRTVKQNSVALSTTEAEYYAMSEGVKSILWARHLLSEVDECYKGSTSLRFDNQGQSSGAKMESAMPSMSQ